MIVLLSLLCADGTLFHAPLSQREAILASRDEEPMRCDDEMMKRIIKEGLDIFDPPEDVLHWCHR